MKRLLAVTVLVVASVLSLGACNKPSEDSCRKALANMQRLMGTENVRDPGAMEGEVRRCKGGSKKSAVDCAIKAQTFEELKHCNFYDLPDNVLPSNLRTGSGATNTGSAAGSAMSGSAAGSAMSGSAMSGSADMGSAAGSAAMGSGAGSAAMGSAAMGSAAMGSGAATGSGAGSAAKGGTGAGSAAKAGAGPGSAAKTGMVKPKADMKKAVDSADPMEGGQ